MRLAVIAATLAACTTDPSLAPPTGESHRYLVTSESLPLTNAQARELGLDLNEDQTVDNQLGMVFSTLSGMGIPAVNDAQTLIASGALRVQAQLQYAAAGDPDDTVAFTMFTTESVHDPLLGLRDNPLRIGPGTLTTAIPFFGEVVELELIGARVKLLNDDPTRITGVVAGGLRKQMIDNRLVPVFGRMIETVVASQCTARTAPPDCGCPLASDANRGALYWLGTFDVSPNDCVVTEAEIKAASIVRSLTAPDVEIDGEELLSIGFGFAAEAQ